LKILVTGAAGFIGSACAAMLASEGHDIVAVDNFSHYYSVDLKKLRVREFLKKGPIHFKELELADRGSVEKLFNEEKFDSVIHFAAQPGVRIHLENWDKYTRDNLVAFSNVLLSSARFNVKNFLYASSSSVYGNTQEELMSEDDQRVSPVSFYGATKLANEKLAESISISSGLKTRGLRFFTVYGPWGRPDMAYFRTSVCLINSKPFELLGDGSARRDFTYIDDVVEMTCELMNELHLRQECFYDVVNIGGGSPKSINEIIQICELHFGKKLEIIHRKKHPGDVDQTYADYTYLASLLNKWPKTTTEDGLGHFVSWAKSRDISGHLQDWVRSV
jgi:UDP-glucuronate 4-epimerase